MHGFLTIARCVLNDYLMLTRTKERIILTRPFVFRIDYARCHSYHTYAVHHVQDCRIFFASSRY